MLINKKKRTCHLQENKTNQILWDFKIKTDHLILDWRPVEVLINKKKRTCHLQENKTNQILWDFKIKTDHLILDWRPVEVLINKKKKTCHLQDFIVPADHTVKMKKNEKIDKYLDLAIELKKFKKLWNMKMTVVLIVDNALGTALKSLVKTGRIENRKKNWNYPDHCIVKIG